jgi:hypothetical protein
MAYFLEFFFHGLLKCCHIELFWEPCFSVRLLRRYIMQSDLITSAVFYDKLDKLNKFAQGGTRIRRKLAQCEQIL